MDQRKAGILLTYLNEAVKLLTAIVYTPVLLRLLGQNEYGLYQLAVSLISCLSLLNFGFGSTYIRYYSRSSREGPAVNGLFALVFGGLGVLCLLLGGLLWARAEVLLGSGLTAAELARGKRLLPVLTVVMALVFPGNLFSGYMALREKFVFPKLMSLFQSVLNPFLALALLLSGWQSMAPAVASLVAGVMGLLANGWYCRRLGMRLSFRQMPLRALRGMSSFAFFVFADQLINQVNWSVDKLLLGRACGTAAVAVYGIGGQINSLFIQLSTAVSAVFIPEVHRLAANKDHTGPLTALMIRLGRVQLMVVGLVLGGFFCFGREFIRLWAGEGYEDAYAVGLILMCAMLVPLIQTVGIEILRAKDRHRFRVAVFSALLVGNILLSIRLIPEFGPVGAALGTLAALAVGDIAVMNWYYHSCVGLDMIRFWKDISGILPPAFLTAALGTVLSRLISGRGWAGLLAGIIVYIALYGLLLWQLGLKEQEKRDIQTLWKGRRE